MELILKTDVGELTVVFIGEPMANYRTMWTAYIKEYPGVITQSDSIGEAMKMLPGILDTFLEVQIQSMMDDL